MNFSEAFPTFARDVALIFAAAIIVAAAVTFAELWLQDRRERKNAALSTWKPSIFVDSLEKSFPNGYRAVAWQSNEFPAPASWMLFDETHNLIAQGSALNLIEAQITAVERYDLELLKLEAVENMIREKRR